MKAEDVPFLAALIFPGFFAIQGFIWTTRPLKTTDAMRIMWAFVFSVPLFFATHGFFRWVVMVSYATLPPPETIAKHPADAPIWFLLSLYGIAAMSGYLTGLLWQKQFLDAILLRVGLDVRRTRPVLSQGLSQRAYVDVVIKDGLLLRGWPFIFDDEDSFIYLVNVQKKLETGDKQWAGVGDVLIALDTVERIYPINPARPLYKPAKIASDNMIKRSWRRIRKHPERDATQPEA